MYTLLGCSTSTVISTTDDFMHKGYNFGPNKNADFRKGVVDACRPIDCDYIKDLKKLRENESYRKGWEEGLLKCKGKGKEEHLHGI